MDIKALMAFFLWETENSNTGVFGMIWFKGGLGFGIQFCAVREIGVLIFGF